MTNNPRDDLMALADRLRVRLGESRTVTIDRTLYFDLQEAEKALRLAASRPAPQQTTSRVGAWLAAALDDPKVCAEMKADIEAWMNAGEPSYLPAPVDREAVARALCESGKFETGEGTCSLLCMDQLGSVRKKGCNHLTRVHGKLVDSILSLIRPAEPVEASELMTPEEAWHNLVEMTDRTSPEEYPDHALITFEELKDYMLRAVAKTVPASETEAQRGLNDIFPGDPYPVAGVLQAMRQGPVNAIGAGISRRDFHATETAYNQLRDAMDDLMRRMGHS